MDLPETEGGFLFEEELPPDHRSGFVAIIGKPNVGKSTLLNAWLGLKVAAVSPKPQTTRNRLLGILTRPDVQIVFVDTPGIHLPRTKLGSYMVSAAQRAMTDADLVLYMVDGTEAPTQADQAIAEQVRALQGIPVLLAINKIDQLGPDQLTARLNAYRALGVGEDLLAVSALQGDNRDALLEEIVSRLPQGPRYYPADQVTDLQERFIASELIREQAMTLLQHEIPHATAVVVDEFKQRENNLTYIGATIYVEKDSQKPIVIGRGGAMLKQIGRAARKELEAFLDQKVFLELWVKVRKNWRRDDQQLRQLGYTQDD